MCDNYKKNTLQICISKIIILGHSFGNSLESKKSIPRNILHFNKIIRHGMPCLMFVPFSISFSVKQIKTN